MGDAPKYNRTKHATCLGCGVTNSNSSPNENSCLFHTPEKEESIAQGPKSSESSKSKGGGRRSKSSKKTKSSNKSRRRRRLIKVH